jgi:hypothetical protein
MCILIYVIYNIITLDDCLISSQFPMLASNTKKLVGTGPGDKAIDIYMNCVQWGTNTIPVLYT